MEQQAVMLRANVDKLKRLIQQVLDFRKMDVGKLKLNVSEGEINENGESVKKSSKQKFY
jgi:signal transduction histidine kinase